MAGSLKDQLLKAGLVSKHQVRTAESAKRKNKGQDERAAGAELARRAQAEKAERDRELNRARQEAAQRKADEAAIRQLIEANRVERGEGEIPYNFIHGNKVRRIHVTREIQARLVKGALCVARFNQGYELVPAEVAEKIRARDPSWVVVFAPVEETPAEDDPYAAYQVPDDLIW